MLLLLISQWAALGDAMPLCETAAAARRRGVLRNENRMSAIRRLLPVVSRLGRRKPLRHQTRRMSENRRNAFCREISALGVAEPKPPTKRRALQCREDRVQISHIKLGKSLVVSNVPALVSRYPACSSIA
jgi:hypothetical protein